VLIVNRPEEKLAFLDDLDILIDDLTTNHHNGGADLMMGMINELERRRLLFHRFDFSQGETWESLGAQLINLSKQSE